MTRATMGLWLSLSLCIPFAARSQTWKEKLPFARYADFHIHPTYKHYFRPTTADSMRMILAAMHYDAAANRFNFAKDTAAWFRFSNWVKYPPDKVSLKEGLTSNLRNYDQASYPEIMHVPGSLLCNGYSPYEKQFALKWFKRFTSSKLVTGMGLSRLNAYSKNDHTPFNDFMAEYAYNLMQQEEMLVTITLPKHGNINDGKGYQSPVTYYDRIIMVKDSTELAAILKHNDEEFSKQVDAGNPPHFVTPMVMSIEGAQVLYDTLSGARNNILEGQCDDCPNKSQVQQEIMRSVYKLKNLPHRLFFITLGHFAQNHVVGFAKTLDRDPENFAHRAIATLTKLPKVRNDLIYKDYAGFNDVDSLGYRVVRLFLDPDSSVYHKPTYIDVKHMDIKARIEYYHLRRRFEQERGVHIPIIASHFAVSGEKQAMAAATGLWPNFDRYVENESVYGYYRHHILKNEDVNARKNAWRDIMNAYGYGGLKLDNFERRMYRSLQFGDTSTANVEAFDPFENYVLDDDKNVGWFYPWSINLFDEEIIEIAKSDGIIGLLMDLRQHGAFMPNYSKSYRARMVTEYTRLVSTLDSSDYSLAGINASELYAMEYIHMEPILRNMFYIVRLLLQQEDAETTFRNGMQTRAELDSLHKKYSWFVPDDTTIHAKKPWECIGIGSDFDGLIDPVNTAPTASYVPRLHQKLILYAYIFAQIHRDEFFHPVTHLPLITTIADSKEKMERFFYSNGVNFIKKYF